MRRGKVAAKMKNLAAGGEVRGIESGGDRTHDPQIKSLLLYRLSYAFYARFGGEAELGKD